ncbi:hypothetical protein BG20_I1753 [Candidatus Nitrosarchaeum limnium BG20]|uniref:Uncharacterized protein n=1 Tax=Candidatus Nitrosarchaeum limnium BG20 TaxID=859192 RepID=S2EPK6_9ARCH|nr:hypothetical protein BG20_I1753 [Candidatus Nitrosarchaeum limnium BG20]
MRTATDAEDTNNIKFRYECPPVSAPYSQLYIFENLQKIIKDQLGKSFGQIINSLYPFYQQVGHRFNESW